MCVHLRNQSWVGHEPLFLLGICGTSIRWHMKGGTSFYETCVLSRNMRWWDADPLFTRLLRDSDFLSLKEFCLVKDIKSDDLPGRCKGFYNGH